ncbi:hypothetical protein F5148DRAFT_1152565 [Russula earlei]|uniref:Uncharacterized protein n=1 Tax=Russula earlei TaxID=71964 RepID=A0ACC0TVX7_9AGAM|nr:hypothetical protein F5148DRAFT_1152565 [Russula earlei]
MALPLLVTCLSSIPLTSTMLFRSQGTPVPQHIHSAKPHVLAPLLKQLNKEGLCLMHAAWDVIVLCMDAEGHAHGTTHAKPIDSIHGCPTHANPLSQHGKVEEEKAQASTIAMQQHSRWQHIGGQPGGLDDEGVEILLGL